MRDRRSSGKIDFDEAAAYVRACEHHIDLASILPKKTSSVYHQEITNT